MPNILHKETREAQSYTTFETDVDEATMPNRSIDVTGDVGAGALTNPNKSCTLILEAGTDAGGGVFDWNELIRADWVGNSLDRNGTPTPPVLSYSTSSPLPLKVRVRLDLPQQMVIGLDLVLS